MDESPVYNIMWSDMSDMNFELIQRALLDELNRQYNLGATSINQIGIYDIPVHFYPDEGE